MDMWTFFFSEAWSKACHEKSADAIVGEKKTIDILLKG